MVQFLAKNTGGDEKFPCGTIPSAITPVVFGSPKILNQAIVILKIQKVSIKCLRNVCDTTIFHLNCKRLLKTYVSLNIMSQSEKNLMQ